MHHFCLVLATNLLMNGTSMAPAQLNDSAQIKIIPQPLSVEVQRGRFLIRSTTSISYPVSKPELRFAATYLRKVLHASTGFPLGIKEFVRRPLKNTIVLDIVPDSSLGKEGYFLLASPSEVHLNGGSSAGTFYAVQTLLQLLPPEVFSPTRCPNARWAIPGVTIRDRPRYPWRGMMLDVARHFFPKAFVMRFIDELAFHKMNTFHWHLCDDQGWRIQILGFPRLTQVSAWRTDREGMHWNVRPPQAPGEAATYGGFYTQDDIREIVQYASDRHITIVPEIEMPAHATAVLAAYPQLSCTGGPFTVPTGSLWPIKDIYCAGNDSVFTFLEKILTEVAGLFPGTYIHVGGDEADKTEWKRCSKCQARIKAEGLSGEEELQSYFIKRIERFLVSKGKRLIGWDEILEGGLPPEATVMSWRGIAGGIEAAKSGHEVVMTPTSNCYFDYYQGDWKTEPVAIGGYVPIHTVYAFEPTSDSLTPEESTHVLGTQGNLWSEFLFDPAKVEYMAFPRISAIAEVAWTAKERRSWASFTGRLEAQMKRYGERHLHFARSAFNVTVQDSFDVPTHSRLVSLQAEIGQDGIHYTLNGKDPVSTSPLYEGPIRFSRGANLAAATFDGTRRMGEVRRQELFLTPEESVLVTVASPLDTPFVGNGVAGLADNVRAAGLSHDIQWHGVRGKDFVAVLDLGAVRTVRKLAAGFYHSSAELIFLPTEVTFELSTDGIRFQRAAAIKDTISPMTQQALIRDFSAPIGRAKARYIRMTAKSIGPCPSWHIRKGEPTWLLVDEIFVE